MTQTDHENEENVNFEPSEYEDKTMDSFEEEEAKEKKDSGNGAEADKRLDDLAEELARTKDHMLRALADAENARKRATRDREEAGKYAITSFARDLLDFADNFSRAMEAIPSDLKDQDERIASVISGIEAMEKELQTTFSKHGIVKMEPKGEPFNPHFHEVMFEAPGTGKPAGTIVQLIEAGYMIHDRLLRPARVGVAKGDNGNGEPGSNLDTEA